MLREAARKKVGVILGDCTPGLGNTMRIPVRAPALQPGKQACERSLGHSALPDVNDKATTARARSPTLLRPNSVCRAVSLTAPRTHSATQIT